MRDLMTAFLTDRDVADRLSWLYEHCAARGYGATAGAVYTAIQNAVLIDEPKVRSRPQSRAQKVTRSGQMTERPSSLT